MPAARMPVASATPRLVCSSQPLGKTARKTTHVTIFCAPNEQTALRWASQISIVCTRGRIQENEHAVGPKPFRKTPGKCGSHWSAAPSSTKTWPQGRHREKQNHPRDDTLCTKGTKPHHVGGFVLAAAATCNGNSRNAPNTELAAQLEAHFDICWCRLGLK